MRVLRSQDTRIVVESDLLMFDIFYNLIRFTAFGFAIGLHIRNIGNLLLPLSFLLL